MRATDIRVRFQPFELDLDTGELWKAGSPVRLQPQPAKVLCLLVSRAGRLVCRDELQRSLWRQETFVDFDQGLNYCIRQIRSALQDSADDPRFVETVPRRGYRFAAAIEEVPRAGIGVALEAAALAPAPAQLAPQPLPGAVHGEQHATPTAKAILAAVIILSITSFCFYVAHVRASRPMAGSVAAKIKPRRTVAVLGIRSVSARRDDAWLPEAFSEMLSTELAAGGRLRIVPAEDVMRARSDLQLPDTDTLAADSLRRLHDSIGADMVIAGSCAVVGPVGRARLRVDLRVQDSAAGETVAQDSVTGNENDLFELVSDAGERLRQKLGATAASARVAEVTAALPSNERAARSYAEGVGRLRLFEFSQARDLLQTAVAADPESPLSHSALASAWSALGYDSRAEEEGQRAFSLTSRVSNEQRLAIEAQWYELNKEWPKAVETYRTLYDLFPDNVQYGLSLARLQINAGDTKSAQETIASLRKLPPPEGSDPRIDLAESQLAQTLGDFKRELALAQTAAAKGRSRQARLLIAQARMQESWALERIGDLDRANVVLTEARTSFAAAGDLQSAGKVLLQVGGFLYDRGDFGGARRKFEEALTIFRQLGTEKTAASAVSDIGNTYYEEGSLRSAQAQYQQALVMDRKAGYVWGVASDMGSIANVLDGLGELVRAQQMQEAALRVFTQVGDKRATASTYTNIGVVLEEQGKLLEAEQKYEQAYELHSQTGYRRGMAYALAGEGRIFLQQDRLAEARNRHEQALAIRRELGDAVNVASSSVELATVALEQGNPVESQRLCREATRALEGTREKELAASAYAMLAISLVVENQLAEAKHSITRATELAAHSSDHPTRFLVTLAKARVAAVSGDATAARAELRQLVSDASRDGYTRIALEGRLALATLAYRKTPAGQAELVTVDREARQKGLNLLARKASNAN